MTVLKYNLTSLDKIKKVKCNLYKTRPFFSYILMNMNIEESNITNNCSTLCITKTGKLYWNKEFIDNLSVVDVEGCLMHEAMHMVNYTFDRRKHRDTKLWNIATDLVINLQLLQDDISLPKEIVIRDYEKNKLVNCKCLIPTKEGEFTFTGKNEKKYSFNINNKTCEEVYDILEKNSEIINQYFSMKGEGDTEGDYKGQIDHHSDDSDSENDDSAKTKANKEYWKRIITEASVMAKNRGLLSNGMERAVNELLTPKIDWRRKVSEFITRDIPCNYTYAKPNRRYFSTGVYTPNLLKENLEIICGIDVSGSISQDDYTYFATELYSLVSAFAQIKMRVIGWGTEVNPEDDFVVNKSTKNKLIDLKLHGGGGTELGCFGRYIIEKKYRSNIYIILTDGFIESEPDISNLKNGKIIFVLSKGGNPDIIKNYGNIAYLDISER